MSGFEISGVVLGVLPLLISAVGTYDSVYRPFITRYKDYEPALKNFRRGLITERALFRNECRILLSRSVDSRYADDLLEDLKHDGWADTEIEKRVSEYLGDSKEDCEAAVARIKDKLLAIMKEYQRYGITTDSELPNPDHGHIDRAYWKLKFSWSEARLDQQLQELILLNQSFHTLSEQVKNLASYGSTASEGGDTRKKLKDYGIVQEVSIQLCKALETACISHPEHSAHFGLDVDYVSITKDSKIKFELAFKSNTYDSSQQPVWLRIDSEFDRGSSEFKTQSLHQVNVLDKLSNPIRSHQPLGISPKPRSSHSFLSWFGLSHSTLQSSHVQPTSQSCATLTVRSADVSSGTPLLNLNIHQNLCEFVELQSHQGEGQHGGNRKLIGCLDKNQAFKHFVYLITPQPVSGIEKTFTLSDLISADNTAFEGKYLSPYDKLRLARQLAAGVLQFNSTPLLRPAWRSEDIIFFGTGIDKRNRTAEILNPHLRVQFQDQNEMPHLDLEDKPLQNESDDEDEDAEGIRNQYLYQLAIIFIELAHLTPINELYEKHSKEDWDNCKRIEYKLAQRLSKSPSRDLGPRFGKLIRRCLACDFGHGTNLADSNLREAFHREIVSELQRMETELGKYYCVSTRS